ncbi:hypothetical protein T01_12224 [Trichinella spiralis]|uniref:Uncharacterized protein n=1 Tax=Trichinella spiralis TaxID=6334 RepID=A0A0V1BTV8_TRISP|nr:hypothetical protein T01_12224 [Trichinella spiralis]
MLDAILNLKPNGMLTCNIFRKISLASTLTLKSPYENVISNCSTTEVSIKNEKRRENIGDCAYIYFMNLLFQEESTELCLQLRNCPAKFLFSWNLEWKFFLFETCKHGTKK